MKNILVIDVDSTREDIIKFSKPQEYLPQKPEDAKEIFVNDITCTFEAFCFLLKAAHDNGYIDKNGLINIAIEHLTSLLSNDISEGDLENKITESLE